ncbi:MAG: hypothetical protein COB37_06390 [Kordiimonadales bacterium]|nr:MAG: hypothetical protein COB37_06390 [Kordiimonadales bacterium]
MSKQVLTANQVIARANSCAKLGKKEEAIRLYSLIPTQARPYKKAQRAIQKLRQTDPTPESTLPQKTIDTLLKLTANGLNREALKKAKAALKSYPKEPFLYKFCGDVQLALGNFSAAHKSGELALALAPKYAKAHTLTGLALLRLEQYDQAKSCFLEALEINSDYFDAHFDLGNCYNKMGQDADAVKHYSRATELDPNHASAHFNLGCAYFALDNLKDAKESYNQTLKLKPDHTNALLNLGIILKEDGDPKTAISYYKRILKGNPSSFEALCNLGAAQKELRQFKAATESYLSALKIKPDHWEAHNLLGINYEELKQLEDAIASFDTALSLNPLFPHALHNKGNVLKKLGQVDAAIACYQQSLKITEKPETYNVLGIAYKDKGDYSAAISNYLSALAINPDDADVLNNIGNAYSDVGRLDEALESHNKAIKLKPDFAEVHFNAANVHLLKGDFKKGWPLYERRFQVEAGSVIARYAPHKSPRWIGESLEGKTIIIMAEQGLGDLIQFVRYPRHLKALGAHVILETKAALIPLFKSIPFIDEIFASDSALPFADCHCPIMSLPFILEDALDQSSAHTTPYIFADKDRVLAWEERLKAMSGYRVGVSWQGSVSYSKDKWRSMPLQEFSVFGALPNVSLISLQKGERGVEQIPAFRENNTLFDVEELIEGDSDLMDAAAVMMNLDLVITSCTSIAHLAGALGVPTWVMIGKNADWRWLLDREDSPWYANVKLFRQTTKGDWETPFQRAANELKYLSSSTPLRDESCPKRLTKPAPPLTEPIFKPFQGKMNIVVGLFNAGNLEAAKQRGETLAAAYPNAPILQNLLGVIHGGLNDPEAAVSNFRRATELLPSYAQAFRNLSLSLRKLGQTNEADHMLAKAVSLEKAVIETRDAPRKTVKVIRHPISERPDLERQYAGLSRQQIFSKIYETSAWGRATNPDMKYVSGWGSHNAEIIGPYVAALNDFLSSFAEKPNVVDLGCGDFNVGSKIRAKCGSYTACDIVPALIDYNKSKYKDLEVDFRTLDLVSDPLPTGDIVFIRQVLQHLNNDDVLQLVKKLPAAYRFLVLTEHIPSKLDFPPNRDKPTGSSARDGINSGIVLTEQPFDLPILNEKTLCEASKGGDIIQTIVYQLR